MILRRENLFQIDGIREKWGRMIMVTAVTEDIIRVRTKGGNFNVNVLHHLLGDIQVKILLGRKSSLIEAGISMQKILPGGRMHRRGM
jgi:hypothetical protein